MHILDNMGNKQEITDLPAAIAEALEFKDYQFDEQGPGQFNEERRAYWQDIYEKLVALQNEQNSINQ